MMALDGTEKVETMTHVLICTRTRGAAGVASDDLERVQDLRQQLRASGLPLQVTHMALGPGGEGDVLSQTPDAVIVVGQTPAEMAAFGMLKVPCVWDMTRFDADCVSAWLADEMQAAELRQAIAVSRSVADLDPDVALLLEDALVVGLTPQTALRALSACLTSTLVVLGAGLGNMIYGTGLVRWLSERIAAPVDLVIHDRFDQAVALFANAPWVNAAYSGFDYLSGQHYRHLISSITAGGFRPPVTADREDWMDQSHNYNEEGRFIPEPELNFLGLETAFGFDPALAGEVPLPFLRDIQYTHPGNRVIGVAHGRKTGTWAKREWPHMESLVADLVKDGWEVRSFGLPAEYVPGAEDYTHLSMRDCVLEMAECSYFLSHDGGMCHIAEGLGVPTVWLFGPTGSVKNGPVYAQSRVVTTDCECCPSMYKVDWERRVEQTCMAEMPVSKVRAELEALREQVETQGWSAAPRAVDGALLKHEIEALARPGAPSEAQSYLRDRFAVFPGDPAFYGRFVITLLQQGDVVGAASVVCRMIHLWPDDTLARALFGVVQQIHPGQTPVAGRMSEMAFRPLEPEDCKELVQQLAALDLNRSERRFVFEGFVRYWVQAQSTDGVVAFLLACLHTSVLSRDFVRVIQRYLERFAPPNVLDTLLSVEFENSPAQMRMRQALHQPLSERLELYAREMAGQLGLDVEQVLDSAFVPHFNAVDTALLPPVGLQLGEKSLSLAAHSTVLILVPHVMVKHAMVGSSSNVLLLHVTRLAGLGFRPVVVTVGFDDVPQGITLRDSVTYIQGHRHWEEERWQELHAYFKPSLVLGYGDMETLINLPAALRADMTRVSMEGLSDPLGAYVEFTDVNRWECLPPAGAPKPEGIGLDDLSRTMFIAPPIRPALAVAPLKVFCLLNNATDFNALSAVIAAMPSVEFTVMSALATRGIEKNVDIVAPADGLPAGVTPGSTCFMQFSTRPVNLTGEALRFMEQGGRVIAPLEPTSQVWEGADVHTVDVPTDIGAWVRVLRSLYRVEHSQQYIKG